MTKSSLNTAVSVLAAAVSLSVHTNASEQIHALEEIVVTAEKRSESIQDVGLAISAFGGEQLRELGVNDLTDLPKSIPNVDLYDAYGGGMLPVWEIRGVGLRDFNANNTPASAVYVDEVYQVSSAQGSKSLFDIERIEVLKGPQGGLYGRNTSGGAVLLHTNRPNLDEFSGDIQLSYGKYDRTEIKAAVNLPLNEMAALRLSAQKVDSDDKWQTSLSASNDHGEEDVQNFRAQLLLAPNDDLEVLIKAENNENNSEVSLVRAVPTFAAGGAFGGPCGAFISGSSDLSQCFFANGISASALDNDEDEVIGDTDSVMDNKAQDYLIHITMNLEGMVFNAISSYTDFDYGLRYDWTGLPGDWVKYSSDNNIEVFSQEFRLSSDEGERLTWVAGISYSEDSYTEARQLLAEDVFGPVGASIPLNYVQDTETFSVYGQADYYLTDSVKLIGSLRYTDEEKQLNVKTEDLFAIGFPTGRLPEYDLDVTSGKLSLEWIPSEDMLIYTSFSKGFKAGGYFGGFPTTPNAITQYDEEINYAYELGFKSEWLDNTLRVNGAVFYYDYRDGQASGNFGRAVTTLGVVDDLRLVNIGDYEYSGAELEVTWSPVAGLTLQAGAGYLTSEIVDAHVQSADGVTGELIDLEGRELSNVPEWTYNLLARYEMQLADQLSLAVQLDYSFTDEKATEISSSAAAKQFFALDQQKTANARISLLSDEGWQLNGFVRNLTDERFQTVRSFDAVIGFSEIWNAPRSWGFEASYSW
ncbi:TonB-dependent receptor [Pseudomaricurvus alkylphenolicus]|uniref:TonB-dependent receptor domain-containing protein n=1 Tax=Pseudomaricurvus alkylphenolicus TaxID=1306991 RepID=UPI0014238BDB|nr:TonB-dependent receptor [Pseudomaricurvus alkylphenolicus]